MITIGNMKTFPKIFKNSMSVELFEKLSNLCHIYSGLNIRYDGENVTLMDELELYLEFFLVEQKPLQHKKIILAKVEAFMLDRLKLSKFSFLDVSIGDKHWNPREISFKQFQIEFLHDGELVVIEKRDRVFNLIEVMGS